MLRATQKIGDIELKEIMVGDEAAPLRNMLEISYPLIEGTVRDWKDMECLFDYSFKKLGLPEDKSEYKIVLTEASGNPVHNRQKMGQLLFDKYGFGGLIFEY